MTETPSNQPHQTARSQWVLIVTAIVGGVLLVGAIAAAAITGVATLTRSDAGVQGLLTADVRGITELELTTGSADFSVLYDADADQAELEVRDGTREWSLRRDGDSLVVDSHRAFGLGWFSFGFVDRQQVVLRLPAELRDAELDADLDLSSGRLQIDAAFGELSAEVSSGDLKISGSARTLDAEVSSGRMEFALNDVQEAQVRVSSGDLSGVLTGRAPASTEVQVSSGAVQLGMPNMTYDVTSRVSSGSFDHDLRTDPSSTRTIDVGVSSGSVRLVASR